MNSDLDFLKKNSICLILLHLRIIFLSYLLKTTGRDLLDFFWFWAAKKENCVRSVSLCHTVTDKDFGEIQRSNNVQTGKKTFFLKFFYFYSNKYVAWFFFSRRGDETQQECSHYMKWIDCPTMPVQSEAIEESWKVKTKINILLNTSAGWCDCKW